MNPAARLLTIYDILIQQQKDQPLMHTWAAVFELDTVPPHLEDDVTSCIVALRQQIDYTRVRLSEHGVPFELTNPGFDRFKSIASPSLLASPWSSQRGNIQPPECRHAFAWAAWVLHDEDELAMQSEDMANLRAEIDSLGKNLQETAMSPYLRDFIQRQMDTINAALRVYLVQGARPLKDALQKVAGAYTLERGLVETEYARADKEAKGVLNNAGVVIKKTAEVCDSLDKIKKFGESTWSLATSVGPLLLLHVDKLMK